ncbi:MAG: thiamine/thiamine pyrophosphate ABC transporter permease ThiP [Bauldia sp.]|nr:thiamine/thiamine pyrophosphate ABC transporter permease ThiP [Bauldia sp.]
MSRLPGGLALALLIGVVALGFIGLLSAGGSGAAIDWGYVWSLVRISLIQAGLSTAVSLVLGAALALALARRSRFRGRMLLIAGFNAATVLPAIVTVFAIVALFGRSGWIGEAARAVGLDYGSWVYGLDGVLLAHILLNAPLAARVFLAGLGAVSAEEWRLAAQLGMPPGSVFRFIDWPVLRREAAGVAALMFLACFSSFAIVLALGGGPRVSTLEVAIYEAVRFEADFSRAAVLALVQVGACAAILLPALILFGRRMSEAPPGGVAAMRPDIGSQRLRLLDGAILVLMGFLVLVPMATIAVGGVASLASLADGAVLVAMLTSLAIGVPAGALSVALALGLATLARDLRLRLLRPGLADLTGAAATLILVVSPIALSAGLFVMIRQWVNPFAVGIPLVILVNGLMALPFTYRQVEPPLLLAAERFGRLGDSLGLRGFGRLRLVEWPLLRAPLLVALAMATALSLGDLGVASFFGRGELVTLPVLLHERLGSYRVAEAGSVALLLTLLVAGLFLLAQRVSGGSIARPR